MITQKTSPRTERDQIRQQLRKATGQLTDDELYAVADFADFLRNLETIDSHFVVSTQSPEADEATKVFARLALRAQLYHHAKRDDLKHLNGDEN